MRIDLVLKHICLVKSRSSVKSLCLSKSILINDKLAKPSSMLKAGDRVAVDFGSHALTVELVTIPEKQLSKADAPSYYRVISDE